MAKAKKAAPAAAKKKTRAPRPPKLRERSLTIEDAIDEAWGELTTLAEEMREAFDNTPEGRQNDGAGAARGEAADTLENLTEPTMPDELKVKEGEDPAKFTVKWSVRILSPSAERRKTRSDRRYEATETYSAVKDFLEGIADNSEYSNDEKEAAATLVDEIESVVDEAEGVEFPGMYG